MIELGAQLATYLSIGGGIAYRSQPLLQNLLGKQNGFCRVIGGPGFQLLSGAVGGLGMLWSTRSTLERLSSPTERQTGSERRLDWVLLISGTVAITNMALGLARGAAYRRLVASGVAFAQDLLLRVTWLQNLMVTANVGLDLYSTTLLYQEWEKDQTGEKALQVGTQAAMAVIFGLDRQSRNAVTELFREKSRMDLLGQSIGRSIRRSGVAGVDRIRDDPHYLTALMGYGLGLPDSHTFRTAEYAIGRHKAGDLAAERVVKQLADGARVLGRYHGRPDDLVGLDCDLLIPKILRQSRRLGSRIQTTEIEAAQREMRSMMGQHFLVTEGYPRAEAISLRMGPEIECNPARHPTERLTPAESLRGVSEGRPLTRTGHFEAMIADLRAKRWEVDPLPVERPRFGPSAKLYPYSTASFHYEGDRYVIYNLQATSGNILFVWKNGNLLDLPVFETGPAIDPLPQVVKRIEANFQRSIDWLAGSLAQGKDRAVVREGLVAAIEAGGGNRYLFCLVKCDNGLHRWSYDKARQQVIFEGLRVPHHPGGEWRSDLPGRYQTFDDACEAVYKFAHNPNSKAIDTEQITRIEARKQGVVLTVNSSFEGDVDLEFIVDNFRVGKLYEEFLETQARALERLGASGPHDDHYVSLQFHVEQPHEAVSIDPMLRSLREFFRSLFLLNPGLPVNPVRTVFLKMPARPVVEYGREMGLSPNLSRRERDVVRQIVGRGESIPGQNPRGGVRSPMEELRRLVLFQTWYNHNFAVHGSILNLENALQSQVELAARLHGQDPRCRGLIARARDEVRSKRGQAIPTAEYRQLNTPEKFNAEGRLVIDPAGVRWSQRMIAGLAMLSRDSSLLLSPRGQRFAEMREAALREYLGGK
ncbi:MAG: hypothetical protein HYY44_03690 [Deltaproteobacteria bacterium]|nr:hypothetical protein [Deltaproteobacteria bacterium]